MASQRARLSLTFWWVPHQAFLPYRAFLAYQVAFPPYLTYQAFPLPYLDWTSSPAPVPTNPLPPAAVDHVAAVAVFGNPLTRVSGPLNGLAGPYGPKTIDLCHAGDPLCGEGSDWNAHHEYVPGLTDQAAAFVAGLV